MANKFTVCLVEGVSVLRDSIQEKDGDCARGKTWESSWSSSQGEPCSWVGFLGRAALVRFLLACVVQCPYLIGSQWLLVTGFLFFM